MRMTRDGMRQIYCSIGVPIVSQWPALNTFEDVGKAVGLSKQNAYWESVIAIGKLVYRLRKKLNIRP